MESGDHTHTEKFVSGSAELSKLQQYAELGMMENLHKREQLGFMGDKHQPEDFLFGGAMKNDMHVASESDSNQFIIHESRTNVSTEEGLLPARTNNDQPIEAGINEGLSVTEKIREDLVPIAGDQTSSEILVPSNGQIIETNTERVSESTNGLTFTQSDNENIISQDPLSESIPKDSVNTNSQTTKVVTKERTQINKTDVGDLKSNEKSLTLTENVEFISDGQVSTDRSTVDKSEPVTLSEVKSEMEYVKGSSDDSNSFICNERSEVQRKTENDEISEAEEHKQFLSHEGDGEHSDREKQQTDLEDKHPTCIPSEKGDFVEDKNKTEAVGRTGETNIGQNEEDLKLCPAGKQEKYENTNCKTTELPESKHETEDEWLDILGTGHLKKKIIKKAENEYRPQSLQICEINLEGRLEDGTVVEKCENLKIQIGDVEVVQGIDLALPLMNVGEVALLEVGPRFAYGTIGRSPDIPPDAKLIYTIELLSAEDEPDLESLSIARRKELGDKKRERGNWWFSRQEYSFAIQSYRRAIEFLDDAEGGFSIEKKDISEDAEKQLQELLEDRLKVFNNLAAAQMKIKAYDAALTSVDNVLRCQPQNVKALFRKGKILAAKGDTTTALSVLRNASQLEPESKVIKQEVQRLLDVIKRDTKQEKSLYKKMLGQNKSAEKTSSRGSRISYRTWGIACSSVAVVLLGAIAYRYKFL
uniref:peptidylprolyl isomerase n=1 Tax=Locusta migratoria manilensis TaxID=229990 RepID=A0A977IV23_LOCMI|nr:FK506 binding protein [Locusta migratoria manilensis]